MVMCTPLVYIQTYSQIVQSSFTYISLGHNIMHHLFISEVITTNMISKWTNTFQFELVIFFEYFCNLIGIWDFLLQSIDHQLHHILFVQSIVPCIQISASALHWFNQIDFNTSASLSCHRRPEDLKPYNTLSTRTVCPSRETKSGPPSTYTFSLVFDSRYAFPTSAPHSSKPLKSAKTATQHQSICFQLWDL
jgi:hypothetical protein